MLSGNPSLAQTATRAYMNAAKRWLLWKSIPNEDPSKKPRKVPYYVDGTRRQGELDSQADWAKLASYEDALDMVATGNYSGLGFALGPDETGGCWQGCDLDAIAEHNLDGIAAELPGYVERSPSGEGVHSIGFGQGLPSLGSNGTGVEFYSSGRYFTFTHDELRDGPLQDLASIYPKLQAWHSKKVAPTGLQQHHAQLEVLPEYVVVDIRSALASLESDDRNLWVNVGLALCAYEQGKALWLEWSQKSLEKFDPADAERVWRSCKAKDGGRDYQSIFYDAEQTGWVNPARHIERPEPDPEVMVIEEEQESEPEDAMELPTDEDLSCVPGMLQAFVDFYACTAITPQPELAVQAALALGAVCCGRKYKTVELPNFSNLWFLGVAKSGAGKEHSKWAIEKVLNEAGHGDLINNGYTSKGAVFSMLTKQPNHISIIDELGRYLDAAQDRGHAHFKDGVTTLMESWNRSDGILRPPQYSERGLNEDIKRALSQPVVNPSISLLGMTTPSTLFNSLTRDSIQDGFLPRFIITMSNIEATDELRKQRPVEIPDVLVEWTKAALAPLSQGNLADVPQAHMETVPHIVPMTDEAWEVIQAAKKAEGQMRRDANVYDVPELVNRMAQKALRISLILAVSVDPAQPMITRELAEWGVAYAKRADETLVAAAVEHMVDGPLGQLMKKLVNFIERGKLRGRTEREINKAYKGHGKRALSDSLQMLKASDEIEFRKVKHKAGRGRPREAWVHKRYISPVNRVKVE
ncbi:MAG: DUF3987 domain-containing protein [Sedimenticola sp.]